MHSTIRWSFPPVLLFLSVGLSSHAALAKSHLLVAGRQTGEVCRVEVSLEVGGHLNVVHEAKVRPLKMSAVGKLSYDERMLPAAAASPSAGLHPRSVRYYERAEAVIKVEDGGVQPKLREERRLIVADFDDQGVLLSSPQGPLDREELDLLQVPGNSLLLDALLPERPVEIGDRWQHPDHLLAALLGLDAVSQSDLHSVLKAADANSALIEMGGLVQGAIEGVASKMEVKGRYRYDVLRRQVTRLTLLIKEDRSIGHVAPGVDVIARLELTISPGHTSEHLSPHALDGLNLATPITALDYSSTTGEFRFQHDRRWHLMGEESKVVTLRLVDRGELIAQCNVSPLPEVRPGTHVTLERFQQDIRRSLGNDFGQFLQASQSSGPPGQVLYRVVASGLVAELPIQWHYYLIADSNGRQVAFAFTVEQELLERLGTTDQEMVATFEFLAAPAETASRPTAADPQ